MVKKKKYVSNKADEKEMVELRAHNKIIDEKEKKLKVKHQKMWEKKKDKLRGFNG
tara:strand:+ start:144 stop:308 length:165 start_codon:yes stop_codon:yes gene_type:complete